MSNSPDYNSYLMGKMLICHVVFSYFKFLSYVCNANAVGVGSGNNNRQFNIFKTR